jgi:hypothetical protein
MLMKNWPPESSEEASPDDWIPLSATNLTFMPPSLAGATVEPLQSPDTPPVAPTASRRQRMWPVLLALYFLAPVLAELLSGSTPPLLFIQPFGLIFTPLLYGASALLIREILVRRQLGWGNALILGAAFGVFQEALVVQTWYNFMATSSPSHSNGLYGVWLGTNWVWALNLTIYHAVISITLPLIGLTLLFPQRALAPGLRRRGVILLLLWLLIPCSLLAVGVARTQYAQEGYRGPPLLGYLLGCALAVGLVLLGSFARIPAIPALRSSTAPRRVSWTAEAPRKGAPGLWVVRFTMFGLTTAFFLVAFVLPATKAPPPLTMAISAGLFSVGLWRIASWSAREGWSARHWLALIMGVQGWDLVIWAPLVEFVFRLPMREGLTLANLIVAVALFVLDWRLARRNAATAVIAATATTATTTTTATTATIEPGQR